MNEKLQTKEPTVVEPVAESTSGKTTSPITNMQAAKAEDHLSTGSGGSAVVDTDAQQLVDSSGESYFHETFHGDCIMGSAVDGGGVHSEEDDRSDDGCNYLPFGENHHHVVDNWWGVWN